MRCKVNHGYRATLTTPGSGAKFELVLIEDEIVDLDEWVVEHVNRDSEGTLDPGDHDRRGDGERAGYGSLTVVDLRARCVDRNLDPSGVKADLVARLEEADALEAAEDAERDGDRNLDGPPADRQVKRGKRRGEADREGDPGDEGAMSTQDAGGLTKG